VEGFCKLFFCNNYFDVNILKEIIFIYFKTSCKEIDQVLAFFLPCYISAKNNKFKVEIFNVLRIHDLPRCWPWNFLILLNVLNRILPRLYKYCPGSLGRKKICKFFSDFSEKNIFTEFIITVAKNAFEENSKLIKVFSQILLRVKPNWIINIEEVVFATEELQQVT
jgi:hypothetical protein